MISSVKQFFLLLKNVFCLVCKETVQWVLLTETKSVRDDIIVVTGGGRGIGREIALEFASHRPAHIVLLGRSQRPLKETAEEVHLLGVNCSYMICDVAEREDVYSCSKEIKARFGEVTILVNNAGVVYGNTIIDAKPDDIEQTFNVNLLALFWTLKAFLPDMIDRGRGHVVNISSVLGLFGVKGAGDYCSSKFAATSLTESLRQELRALGQTGIKVTSVHPYHVDNDMFPGMHTRISYFVPSLSEKYVAKKTVQAVLLDRSQVIMPRVMYLVCWLNSIMPVSVRVIVNKATGADQAMGNITRPPPTATHSASTTTATTSSTTTTYTIAVHN